MAQNHSTTSRQPCFGLGFDLDSRQRTPIHECQRCDAVSACSQLRVARYLEQNVTASLKTLIDGFLPHGRR